MTVTEILVGEKNDEKIPIFTRIWLNLISLPYRIIFLFIGRRHNYSKVMDSEWTDWYPFPTDGHKIERKIIAETGFDDCIKFYQLRTTDKSIDELLTGKIFGDFHWEKDYGIFLRQFDHIEEWPISYLIFIDTSDYSYHKLKKVNSSFPEWKYEHINQNDFNILTESSDKYSTRLEIRK